MKNNALGHPLQSCRKIEMHLLKRSIRRTLLQAKNAAQHRLTVSRLENHGGAMRPVMSLREQLNQKTKLGFKSRGISVRCHAHDFVFVPSSAHPQEIRDHAVEDSDRVGRVDGAYMAVLGSAPFAERTALILTLAIHGQNRSAIERRSKVRACRVAHVM